MTQAAIANYQSILSQGSRRPDEAATADLLKAMERSGKLGKQRPGKTVVDTSQLQAIATAVLNPLCLLHGPPGTGKTTTIGALLYFLRRDYGYKGRILAAAQSNVAVDNMLEAALSECSGVLPQQVCP
jgi:ABC-type multidrug transport system ATPase subunit